MKVILLKNVPVQLFYQKYLYLSKHMVACMYFAWTFNLSMLTCFFFACWLVMHVCMIIIAAEDLREKSFQRRTLSERKPKNKNSKLRSFSYLFNYRKPYASAMHVCYLYARLVQKLSSVFKLKDYQIEIQ